MTDQPKLNTIQMRHKRILESLWLDQAFQVALTGYRRDLYSGMKTTETELEHDVKLFLIMRKFKVPYSAFDVLKEHARTGGLDFALVQPSSRVRESPLVSRDWAIYNLYLQGKTYQDIAKLYEDKGWGAGLSPEYIGTIVRRVKTKDMSKGKAYWRKPTSK